MTTVLRDTTGLLAEPVPAAPGTQRLPALGIDRSRTLRFTFDEPEAPPLNPSWIQDLMQSASSTGGIGLIDEVVDTPEPVSVD